MIAAESVCMGSGDGIEAHIVQAIKAINGPIQPSKAHRAVLVH